MRHIWLAVIVLLSMLAGVTGHAQADTLNLIVNPDFDAVYAAQRQAAPNPTYGRAEHQRLPKFEAKSVLPYGWAWSLSRDEAAAVAWVRNDGRNALRLRVPKGESLRLSQRYVEVVPGATYTFGLWVKGSGRVDLFVWAAEPAPDETLLTAGLEAGPKWKKIQAHKKVGPHRHLAGFAIVISGEADVTIRQAELSVQTAAPAGANPLLVKPSKDADTLFYEDFDGPTQALSLNLGAALTAKDGGRFGRGRACGWPNSRPARRRH